MELSVSKYAKAIKRTRYAVYKQISQDRLPKGVKTKKVADKIIIVVNTKIFDKRKFKD